MTGSESKFKTFRSNVVGRSFTCSNGVLFATYNKAIWPTQIVDYVLGAIAVAALLRPGRASDRVVSAVLGLMWLCTGVLYHGVFFSSVNKAAFTFASSANSKKTSQLEKFLLRSD